MDELEVTEEQVQVIVGLASQYGELCDMRDFIIEYVRTKLADEFDHETRTYIGGLVYRGARAFFEREVPEDG